MEGRGLPGRRMAPPETAPHGAAWPGSNEGHHHYMCKPDTPRLVPLPHATPPFNPCCSAQPARTAALPAPERTGGYNDWSRKRPDLSHCKQDSYATPVRVQKYTY